MKRVLIICMLAVISLGTFAQKQQGQSSIGFNLGYAFDSENVTIGLDYRYSILDNLRVNPSLTHFAKKNYVNAWAIDLNFHYLFNLGEMVTFYPLAGLSLSFWNLDLDWNIGGEQLKLDANENRFGANLGLGVEVYATDRMTLGVEAKYNIVKDIDQALIALRVGYIF